MHLYDFKETEKMEMRKNIGSRKWHFQHGKKKEIKEKVVNTNIKELKYVQISFSP